MNADNPYESPKDFRGPANLHYPLVSTEGNLTWLLFSFRGRIPRRVFWGVTIVGTFAFYAAVFLVSVVFSEESFVAVIAAIVILTLYAVFLWISLAVQVKRWHDRDKSGWWFFISFVPLVGPFIAFVETGCLRGTVGPNRFGDDPTGDTLSGTTLSKLEDDQMIDAKVIELDGTSATDEHLASIVGNTEIDELRLGGTSVTDSGLSNLRGLRTLRLLDLSLTRITDEGLESLLELPNLNTVWLGGTKVSDAGLNHLTALTNLKEIHVTNTNVTADGVRKFNHSRPDCHVHT